MKWLNSILCLLFSFYLTACQTSQLSEFNKVKNGMDKDTVIDLMGNPQRLERFHSKDRWTYVFYDERVRYEKEIHFLVCLNFLKFN